MYTLTLPQPSEPVSTRARNVNWIQNFMKFLASKDLLKAKGKYEALYTSFPRLSNTLSHASGFDIKF